MLNVESVSLVNGCISLDNGSDLSSISFKELSGPVSYISETLNVESFARYALGNSNFVIEGFCVEELSDCIVDTKTS